MALCAETPIILKMRGVCYWLIKGKGKIEPLLYMRSLALDGCRAPSGRANLRRTMRRAAKKQPSAIFAKGPVRLMVWSRLVKRELEIEGVSRLVDTAGWASSLKPSVAVEEHPLAFIAKFPGRLLGHEGLPQTLFILPHLYLALLNTLDVKATL